GSSSKRRSPRCGSSRRTVRFGTPQIGTTASNSWWRLAWSTGTSPPTTTRMGPRPIRGSNGSARGPRCAKTRGTPAIIWIRTSGRWPTPCRSCSATGRGRTASRSSTPLAIAVGASRASLCCATSWSGTWAPACPARPWPRSAAWPTSHRGWMPARCVIFSRCLTRPDRRVRVIAPSGEAAMAYDVLIRNGTIIDGSGLPAFHGDVAIRDGRIVEIGRVEGGARRVLNADGMAVAPGIIDNHTHYDAQVTWDPLCTYSCYHGATTVIVGNCSLALAPARPEDRAALASVLSHVEAIPLDAINAGVEWSWESIPEYMDALDRRLGVNVACLIGHSAVR